MSTAPTYQGYRPDRLDVDALRHPTEGSRFALACLASTAVIACAVFVFLSTGHALEIALFILVLVLFVLFVRLVWIVLRIQLLANAVQVSAATLPDVDDVVREVRERLAYDGRLDIFVVNKTSLALGDAAAPITMISFFGVHFILVEGDVIGDLSDDGQRRQFVFLLATVVGALKARHTTWSPFLSILQAMVLPKLVGPFVAPWYRATVYTGDRIAAACCGDLDVSLQAFYRDLVGKDISPQVRSGGFVAQSLQARRRTLLRISQLLHTSPHATNRYLELLSFAASRERAGFEAFRAEIGPTTREFDQVLAQLGSRRPAQGAPTMGIVLSVLLLVCGSLAGLVVRDVGLAQFVYSAFNQSGGSEPEPVLPTDPGPTDTPSPIEPAPDPADLFIARLPADLRATCVTGTADTDDKAVLVVDCTPAGFSTPDTVRYLVYPSGATMRAAFEEYVGDMASGACATGSDHRTTWTSGSITRGPLACYTARSGRATVLWGTADLAVLTIAQDQDLEIEDLYAWWAQHAVIS
ncbi:hypothetical protein ACGFIF_28525 [Kribbella sp. NPDC049174]|uniref:hypothetical protein n=1 Tax=Kribbella sp. NPDC049174 TaxID=3364112 RepID=UPI00371D4C36